LWEAFDDGALAAIEAGVDTYTETDYNAYRAEEGNDA
jgi:hypothetical protein